MFYQPQIDFSVDELLGYLRKSQSDDPTLTVEEVLEKHESVIDEWTERFLGGKIPEQNKFREVVSGETMKERPGIQQILRMIESPKIKGVVVVEPQRLTRGDGEEIGRLMKLFKYTDTLIITPMKIYDLRNEYDWDVFKRELERGNDYLEYTKKILNRGRLLSLSQGNYVGNHPPYGYEKDTVMDGKRKCPTLKIKPSEAEVVQMIYNMYVNENMTVHAICKRLDALGVKPRKSKYWSSPAVRDMLTNIHYTGKVKWNWRKTITVVEDGEIKKVRPKNKIGEFLVYDGKHPAIITEELFNAAQEKHGNNVKVKSNVKVRNVFAGLLYCHCGRAIVLRIHKNKDGVETCPPRLLCGDQVHCNTGSSEYQVVVDKVCEVLEQCIEDFEIRLSNDAGDSAKLHAKLIKNLEKKLKELNEKELAQWEQQAHPDPDQRMPPHIFKQLNEKLLAEKEEINQALCNAYESMPESVDYAEKIKRFKDALYALKHPEEDVADQNALLKKCIEKIIYKREKPVRITNPERRTTNNGRPNGKGRSLKPHPLQYGANWSNPPVEIEVKLKV